MGCCSSLVKENQQPAPERTSSNPGLNDDVQLPGIVGLNTDEDPSESTNPQGFANVAETHAQERGFENVITNIRATDLGLGLGRTPAGFYVSVRHSGLEWRTENKRASVDDNVVDWRGPIPIPSDTTATVSLSIHASFEFQPMLGNGEQLREVTTTMIHHSPEGLSFTFSPKEGDIISPCSSLLVTIDRWEYGGSDSSTSRFLEPCCSTRGPLEEATDRGHSALSRYQKDGERSDLEHALEQFRLALSICPSDHPCRAAAESNLAMASLIHCQVRDSDESLGISLTLYRNALSARPVGHPDRPSTLIQLASVLMVRFEKQGMEIYATVARTLLHEAMDLSIADSHEKRAATSMLELYTEHAIDGVQAGSRSSNVQGSTSRSTNVDPWSSSDQLLRRFRQLGDIADLEHAISILKACVRSTSVSDPRYLQGIVNLQVAFSNRFAHLGDPSDLAEAISRGREALELTPHRHPGKPLFLNGLGTSLLIRFERFGELSDIEEAISRQREAVELCPSDQPVRPTFMNCLSNSLLARFERLGELSDLDEAISRQRDAVHLTPNDHPEKPSLLDNLANCFHVRFECLGDLHDLDESISKRWDAINLSPRNSPGKPSCLNNLASSFNTRFLRLGELNDLDQAVSRQQDAVHLTLDSHPHKPMFLGNLGGFLFTRFERLGELNDLKEAISLGRNAIELTFDGHPSKPGRLNKLGNCFLARFERLGELSDLEEAISRRRNAVNLTPLDHTERAMFLNSLGSSFFVRFEQLGELTDIEEAISTQRDAVHLTPHGHPDKVNRLNNLGASFEARFQKQGDLSDLEEAISLQREAVVLTPRDHPHKPLCLYNLSNSLYALFRCHGQLDDLEEAISSQQDAIDLTPDDHPHRPLSLYCLGNYFRARFNYLGELNDLNEAISRQQDAVHLTPHGHPDKPLFMSSLAGSLKIRYEHLSDRSDLGQALWLSSQAASSPTGLVSTRFYASRQWINCARVLGHQSLLYACSVAVGLLPQLAWMGLSLAHRYQELIQGADIVHEAAAVAMSLGHFETAVEWLEQGRSIVWAGLLQLRSSYDGLLSGYPDHARRLRELSTALEHASAVRERFLLSPLDQAHSTDRGAILSLQQEADRHHALAIERDRLLQEIRQFSGFERFLLHKEYSQLRASAYPGPVVFLNAVDTRCDALIVLDNVDHVIHVPLPSFTLERSRGFQTSLINRVRDIRDPPGDDRFGFPNEEAGGWWETMLAPLWRCVVKPVLDALAISISGELSRIFWCPTGPFTFLPIHAAGYYDIHHSQPGHKVHDFVVSSYVPTLSILAPTSEPPETSAASNSNLRFLAVRQSNSDGLVQLPGTIAELDHIKAAIRNLPSPRVTLTESSVGTVEEVLGLMKEADWVHFACHGIQDAAHPTDSGLCLADRRRLKISDMIGLSRPRGGLAFLSACQTAKGDRKLSDEAIHIAAGMLFAGFGGVVGTVWSISDKLAPDVAKDVYNQLFQNDSRPDCREAARALHDAVQRLRDKNVSFRDWIPFIHLGL